MRDSIRTRTILLVDGEPTVRRTLRHALLPEYRMLEACDGPSALAILRQERVDAVLLELHLSPDPSTPMEGIRLFRLIRRTAPGVPVVIATGSGDVAVERWMTQQGVSGYLRKPLNLDTLKEVLDSGVVAVIA